MGFGSKIYDELSFRYSSIYFVKHELEKNTLYKTLLTFTDKKKIKKVYLTLLQIITNEAYFRKQIINIQVNNNLYYKIHYTNIASSILPYDNLIKH